MRVALLASLLYLVGFAAFLHAVALLCLARKVSAWAVLYVGLGVGIIGCAVYPAGQAGATGRWGAATYAALCVSVALLLWIPSMLDFQVLRTGGRVLVRPTSPEPRSWLTPALFVTLWLVVFPLCDGISALRQADSPEMLVSAAFALTASLSLGAPFFVIAWIALSYLRPSALLERGLWLDGGSSSRWLNSAQKQLVPWDDVVSYEWRSEDPATLEIKTANWTGSQRLYFLRVAAENKLRVDEALQRLAPRRTSGLSA